MVGGWPQSVRLAGLAEIGSRGSVEDDPETVDIEELISNFDLVVRGDLILFAWPEIWQEVVMDLLHKCMLWRDEDILEEALLCA